MQKREKCVTAILKRPSNSLSLCNGGLIGIITDKNDLGKDDPLSRTVLVDSKSCKIIAATELSSYENDSADLKWLQTELKKDPSRDNYFGNECILQSKSSMEDKIHNAFYVHNAFNTRVRRGILRK